MRLPPDKVTLRPTILVGHGFEGLACSDGSRSVYTRPELFLTAGFVTKFSGPYLKCYLPK